MRCPLELLEVIFAGPKTLSHDDLVKASAIRDLGLLHQAVRSRS